MKNTLSIFHFAHKAAAAVILMTVATSVAFADSNVPPDPSLASSPSASAPAQSVTQPAILPTATAAVTEDIRDIRPPIHLPPGWLWMAWAAGGCVLVALGYALWRWRHRLPGLRLKQPYELALEKLEATRSLMQPATAREFSFAVSEVVRSYIEEHFAARAAHRTSDEFLRDCVADLDSSLADHRESLGEFLRHCDLAKFARWILSVDEMEAMLQSACAFVRETGQAGQISHQSPARPSRDRTTALRSNATRAGAPAFDSHAVTPTPGATSPTT